MLQIELFKVYCQEKELAEKTVKQYVNALRQLEEHLIEHDIQELTKLILIGYKNYLLKKYDNVKTINSKIISINVYLKWAIEEAKILDAVLDKIKLKQEKVQSINHKEYIDKSDYQKLCKKAIDDETKYFMYVIANTGLRIAEVKSLKKSDLDSPKIKIKNKGKTRSIAFALWLRKELKVYFSNKNGNDQLFSLSEQTYRVKLKKTASVAKVKKERVYPHSFRHYFAKEYLATGGDLATLQQMLGHSDIATTAIYLKLNTEELLKAFKGQKNK